MTDYMARQPTRKALKDCAEWLTFCLKIGWEKSTLDRLQEIWWKHHDDHGRLTNECEPSTSAASHETSKEK